MIVASIGLILRTRPLTETSLIVHWLTPDFGRIATVAKGARRPKSPFLGKLDLFHEANISFSRSRRSDLHTLREVSLRNAHAGLRQQIGYLQQAAYCARLIEQVTETETPLPALYQQLRSMLEVLPRQPSQSQTIFAFELKLLDELGLKPELERTHLTRGTKQILSLLWASPWTSIARLKLSEAQVAELRHYLHGFLIYHLGRIPKGRVT